MTAQRGVTAKRSGTLGERQHKAPSPSGTFVVHGQFAHARLDRSPEGRVMTAQRGVSAKRGGTLGEPAQGAPGVPWGRHHSAWAIGRQ